MPTVIDAQREEANGIISRLCEPLGRGSVALHFRLLDELGQATDSKKRFSFDYQAVRLRLSGESEKAGDEIERVRALYETMAVHTMMWMLIALYAMWGAAISGFDSPLAVVFAGIIFTSFVMVIGGKEAIKQTEIIDYATKPAPTFDELSKEYVDGELDREAFEQEVETVFEQEAER